MWLLLANTLLGTWPAIKACALTENRTCDPLVLLPALSPLSHRVRAASALFKKLLAAKVVEKGLCWMKNQTSNTRLARSKSAILEALADYFLSCAVALKCI